MGGQKLFGCIEAGGTKFVAGAVRGDGTVLDTARIDTVTPDVTLPQVFDWLREGQARHGVFAALGIACFGPLELDRSAPNWGHITATTKPGWSGCDVGARAEREFGIPVGFDTDVNGAALAESRWGAGVGQRVSVYVTVGTGVGGGTVANGAVLRGLTHAEMGHIPVRRHPDDAGFAGVCPFHGDCLEGLAAGPAIKERWGASLSDLGADHPGHAIIASYLAQLVVTLQSILEPGRIILGGGVMGTPGLLERVRVEAAAMGKGYFRGDPREVVVAPGLGDKSGLLGALALAQDAMQNA